MKRELWIDALKAMLIALVVLGHSIQRIYPDYDSNLLFRVIYSFHMPFFFFVSGFVISDGKGDNVAKLPKRLMRLLVPFVVWGVISFLLLANWQWSYFCDLIVRPDKGLWFLWVLAGVVLLFSIGDRWTFRLLQMIVLFCFICLYRYNRFAIHLVAYYYPFFLLGKCVGGVTERLDRCVKWLCLVLLCVACPLVVCWTRKGPIDLFGLISLDGLWGQLYRMITATVVICGLFSCAVWVKATLNRAPRWVLWIGRSTLGIYAIHQLLVGGYVRYLQTGWSVMDMMICLGLVMAVSSGIVWVLSRNRLTAFLLLGVSAK